MKLRIESLIAGAILGATFSNPTNQKLLLNITQKGASLIVDSLNKRGNLNAPTIIQPEPKPEPESESEPEQ